MFARLTLDSGIALKIRSCSNEPVNDSHVGAREKKSFTDNLSKWGEGWEQFLTLDGFSFL
jgi:hypothetical protein